MILTVIWLKSGLISILLSLFRTNHFRLTEPEPTTDDLDSLMNQIDNRVKSFESETTEQIITQIDKIDPTIKREVLSANTNELAKFVDDAPQSSPEPVYTFGAPRTPTFQIRSSPKVKKGVRVKNNTFLPLAIPRCVTGCTWRQNRHSYLSFELVEFCLVKEHMLIYLI